MLLTSIIVIVCISSFVSALAIFSALVIAGRNNQSRIQEPAANDVFTMRHVRTNTFDEAALKRLAEGI